MYFVKKNNTDIAKIVLIILGVSKILSSMNKISNGNAIDIISDDIVIKLSENNSLFSKERILFLRFSGSLCIS